MPIKSLKIIAVSRKKTKIQSMVFVDHHLSIDIFPQKELNIPWKYVIPKMLENLKICESIFKLNVIIRFWMPN